MSMHASTERVADAGAAVATGVAGVSWLVAVNEWLQLLATATAIVSGGAAAYYYIKKSKDT